MISREIKTSLEPEIDLKKLTKPFDNIPESVLIIEK